MVELKENLAYLSDITGMECKEGDFDQITRVASNLYVDGHNYMMGKDWTQLDEQKLEELCTDMREALSETSTKNVARIKWNDPWAPVFPIYPEGATEERKKETEAFWKRYEEKRFKNGIMLKQRAIDKLVDKVEPSANEFFGEDKEFWKKDTLHAYSAFGGGVNREKGPFVRLLLYARGLTEEEVLDPAQKSEEKKETVQRLKQVIDKESKLSKEEREEKFGQMLSEAEHALYQRKFKPLDLNDSDSLEIYAYNQMIVDEWNAVVQIVGPNKDKSESCRELDSRLDKPILILGDLGDREAYRADMTEHYREQNFEDIPLEKIPKAKFDVEEDSVIYQMKIDGMTLQAKIDVMGLAWNNVYKDMVSYVHNPKTDTFKIIYDEDIRENSQIKVLGQQYNAATSKIEKQNVHNEQLQIFGKYSLEPKEQKKLKEVDKPLKTPLEMLFEKLKDADPAYLKSSEEFKKLKASLAEAVNADPDDITQKMQAVYENANEYILRKAAKPATGHGKERLAVAREIRNTISEMLEQKDSYYQMAEMFDFIRAPRQAVDGTKAKLHQENIIRFTREKVLGGKNPDNTPLNDDERCAVATAFTVAEEYYDKAIKKKEKTKEKINETALKKAMNVARFITAQQPLDQKMESAKAMYSEYMKGEMEEERGLDVLKENARNKTIRAIQCQNAARVAEKDIINNKENIFGGKEKRMQAFRDCRESAKKKTEQAERAYNRSKEKEQEPERKSAGRSL